MGELEDIYTREWFEHDFTELGPEFDLVADTLYRTFDIQQRIVCDVGAGPGLLVRGLRARGVCAAGLEGSEHGIAYAPEDVRGYLAHEDIRLLTTLRVAKDPPISLVVCTEVAEHLDASYADHLVALLASGSCPVVFTAAPPGQDGHHHVNCQPKKYWHEKFEKRGLLYDGVRTENLKLRWANCLVRLSHMARNVMVFT